MQIFAMIPSATSLTVTLSRNRSTVSERQIPFLASMSFNSKMDFTGTTLDNEDTIVKYSLGCDLRGK
jgi:hypothetical protein